MIVFKHALEELKHAKSVKVFAPAGAWAIDEEKDVWLQALSERSDIQREFVAGRGPDDEKDKLVVGRFNLLREGGVDVYETEASPNRRLGLIIFDTCALFGGTLSNGEFEFAKTNIIAHLEVFNKIFEDAKGIANRYE